MTPSETPPPALPRKPGPFDAPVWGWFLVVGTVAFHASALVIGLSWVVRQSDSPGWRYLLSQVDPPVAEGVWQALAGWGFANSPLDTQLLMWGFLALLVVAGLRYRLALLWAALGPVTLLVLFLASLEGPSWAMATLELLVSGAALWVWRWRLSRRQRSMPLPSPMLSVAILAGLGLAMVVWSIPSDPRWVADVAYLWYASWVRADLHLAQMGWPWLTGIGLVLLAETMGAQRPNRQAIRAGWACAGLVAALVIWRSPPAEYLNATDGWPLFAAGEPVAGTVLTWEGPSGWGFDDWEFHPEVSASLTQLLESGRASQPLKLAILAPRPDYMAMLSDPFAPAPLYLTQLRRANPGINTATEASLTASFLAKTPLTDAEVDEWLGVVYSLPSPISEDMALLGNLVGSGRQERAERLAAHIHDGMSRAALSFGVRGQGLEELFPRRGTLLAGYERRLALLGEPDGLARSILVRVVGADGRPLAGVPVGLYQRLGPTPEYVPLEDAPVREEEMAYATRGRFLYTDADGEVLFADLRAVAYGHKVLGGWPESGLAAGMVAIPLADLPNPLPPGLTEVVWRVLPQGTFTQAPDGPLILVPAATGLVVWACTARENDVSQGCPEVLDLSDESVRRKSPGRRWNRVDAIMELGPAGRPRFVWWFLPEETEAAEDAPAPADDTP